MDEREDALFDRAVEEFGRVLGSPNDEHRVLCRLFCDWSRLRVRIKREEDS